MPLEIRLLEKASSDEFGQRARISGNQAAARAENLAEQRPMGLAQVHEVDRPSGNPANLFHHLHPGVRRNGFLRKERNIDVAVGRRTAAADRPEQNRKNDLFPPFDDGFNGRCEVHYRSCLDGVAGGRGTAATATLQTWSDWRRSSRTGRNNQPRISRMTRIVEGFQPLMATNLRESRNTRRAAVQEPF